MINRIISQKILGNFFKGKVILIIGPRQTGKTTLLHQITDNQKENTLWLNGDESDIREILARPTSTALKGIIGNKKIVVIDEAQRIDEIGLTIKLMADSIQGIQILVTGSSALELSGNIKEPLTGRKYEYHLYPLSFEELRGYTSDIEENRMLEQRMIFGYYPDVVNNPSEAKEILRLLSESYLYKDLYMLAQIKKPVVLEKLVVALALQLGNEVNYNELSRTVGSDKETIERYIDLLEKAFVIFRLPSLSRNMRNEIKKGRKIYFYDNGIRNAVIKNFNPLALRQDTGALWENFLVAERKKRNEYSGIWSNHYFWRNTSQQEIDYIEEMDGKMSGFEFKWGQNKLKTPRVFLEAYPGSDIRIITRENYRDFICL
ncbi:MAG: ATPase [Spirochaetes bacterium GWF1_51_8]|nr:MAG: ATPase [Spirochaetes bacterium GWF1_51_8]